MLPVKMIRFRTWPRPEVAAGWKYSRSTPFGITEMGVRTYEASSSRSRGALTEHALNWAPSRRSASRTRWPSTRKPHEKGKEAVFEYSVHFAESASPKSITFLEPRCVPT